MGESIEREGRGAEKTGRNEVKGRKQQRREVWYAASICKTVCRDRKTISVREKGS